jgi:D-beta-D-heptose 7-phosphate kinase/D-beta-D-heptose 1-phosphate adenosyltransferase
MEQKVLVIGDSILDIHIQCDSDRLSPEAPVPVCSYKKEEMILGGAANVAKQIAIAHPCVLTHVSSIWSDELYNLCDQAGIQTLALRTNVDYVLPKKTRVWANGQQVCRIDEEYSDLDFDIDMESWCGTIIRYIYENEVPIVIFSDYNKGSLNDDFIQSIVDYCCRENVITILDPKRPTYRTLKNLTIVTPNNEEIGKTILDPIEVSEYMGTTYLIHTKGADGMDLYGGGISLTHVAAREVGVADACGAGDTVVAFLAMALLHQNVALNTLNDLNMHSAMKIATYAAARTVMHHGNYTLSRNETLNALSLPEGV